MKTTITRDLRTFFIALLIEVVAGCFFPIAATGQTGTDSASYAAGNKIIGHHTFNNFSEMEFAYTGVELPLMALKHYESLIYKDSRKREEFRREITTIEQWKAEKAAIRKAFIRAAGPLQEGSVEVLHRGKLETTDLVIRKIIFNTGEDNWVPANIYIPKNIPAPLPGIVSLCGHNNEGKSAYAQRCAFMALNGYVVISFDFIGTGERQIIPNDTTVYWSSTQHNIMFSKMIAYGANPIWFFIRETMGAVSVLSGLDEVDPDKIGVTGSSGGGYMSVYAAAIDERIKATAPAAAVHGYKEYFVPGDADGEQAFFGMIQDGLDFPDVISFLVAPRPILILSNSRDIWPIGATEHTMKEAKNIYSILGQGERIEMKTWNRGHTFELDQITEAILWFNRWLKNDTSSPVVKPENLEENIPSPGLLKVSPQGNIFLENHKTPQQVFRAYALKYKPEEKDIDGFKDFVSDQVSVGHQTNWKAYDWFVVGNIAGKRIAYSPEPDLLLPVEVLIPPKIKGVMILIDEVGRKSDLDWQVRFASEGFLVLRPDLRGWGETSIKKEWADREGWMRNVYSSSSVTLYTTAHLAGKSLILDRTKDLIALINICGELAPDTPITLWGKRQGGLIAMLAGFVDERVTGLTMEQSLYSFQDVIDRENPVYPIESNIHGLLQWGIDIPDITEYLGNRVKVINPVNALMFPQ